MRNIRLELCYDGSRYKGWQRLPGEPMTIQGKLEQALERILGQPVQVVGSGRTDAGAHALGQVANFHTDSALACGGILAALRRYMPEDIGIYSCSEAPFRFHSRLNAVRKTYRYRVWNSEMPCVFDRRYVYVLPAELDLSAMERAVEAVLGTHDFSAFCSNKHYKKSTVRTIFDFSVRRAGEELIFTVTGDGFLYNMVRILVGTLLEIGMGRLDPGALPRLLEGGSRGEAGYTVPAKGLCLMEVCYQ